MYPASNDGIFLSLTSERNERFWAKFCTMPWSSNRREKTSLGSTQNMPVQSEGNQRICFALFLQSTLESMFCLGCRRVFDYQCLTWQVWVQRNFEKKLIQWCLSCWTQTCFLSSFNFFSFFSFTTTVTLKSKRDPDPPLLEELLQLRGLCFFTFRTWCFTCGGNHLVPSPVSSQRVCTSNLLIEVVPLLPEEPDKKIAWQTEIVMFLIMHCEVSMNTVQTITSAKFSKSAISYKRRIHISRI